MGILFPISSTHLHQVIIYSNSNARISEELCKILYMFWNIVTIDKDTEVWWDSWYTAKNDISIMCDELTNFPIPFNFWSQREHVSYYNIYINVTENSGDFPDRLEKIRLFFEQFIDKNPDILQGYGIDTVKVDNIEDNEFYDKDYKNDVFGNVIRVVCNYLK